MSNILHVIDGSCDESQLQVLAALKGRLGADGGRHSVCCIDPAAMSRAETQVGESPAPAFIRISDRVNWAPEIRRIASRSASELVHVWGPHAAAACKASLTHLPLVLTLLDPAQCGVVSRWVRSFPTQATIAAGSQLIRARLIAAGVSADRVVVIRNPADFAAIKDARGEKLRERVVGDAGPVVLISGPADRNGGQYYALWAAAIIKQVYRKLTVIAPHDSPERRRLVRFVREIRMPEMLTIPNARLTWPRLAACADVFMMPALDEVCTEPLASVMAAGVPVVATAVRSVCEIIADRHNGLLCKKPEPKLLAARLLTAIDDEPLRRQITEVARGQAFEVFGAQAFADNYRRVYRNLLVGKSPGEDVRDTAMVA